MVTKLYLDFQNNIKGLTMPNWLHYLRYTGFSCMYRDIRNATWRKWQLGFNPSDTWNLDYSISVFVLPRLKFFRNNMYVYPAKLGEKKWEEILDSMIAAFELLVDEDTCFGSDEEKSKIINKGLKNFAKYYRALWN